MMQAKLKKGMKITAIMLVVLSSFLLPMIVQAESLSSESAETLANIRLIVRGYDPKALVFLRTVPAVIKNTVLPGTPFKAKNLELKSSDNGAPYKSVKVYIFSVRKKLPKKAESLILGLASAVGKNPQIIFQPYLEGFTTPVEKKIEAPQPMPQAPAINLPQMKPNITIKVEASPAKPEPKVQPAPPAFKVEKLVDMLQLAAAKTSRGFLAFLGLLAFGLLLAISFIFQYHKQLSAFQRGVLMLTNAIESSSGGRASQTAKKSDAERSETKAEKSASARNKSDDQSRHYFETLPEEGLLELLADCYWSEKDNYGAFVWKQLSPMKRKRLLSMIDFVEDYVVYISKMTPIDLGHGQEPYYLSPLSLRHINADTLTKTVRKLPALLIKLPELRLASLLLSAVERLELQIRAGNERSPAIYEFDKLPPSPKRSLQRVSIIKVASVQEEEQLMQMANITQDMMQRVPSLIWGQILPREIVSAILKDFSAVDLAESWIAPAQTLEYLHSCLPNKKADLMFSYLRKNRPSRESEAYIALHQAFVKAHQSGNPESGDDFDNLSYKDVA